MEQMNITMEEFLKELNKSDIVRKQVPLGLGMGLPMLDIIGEELCVSVPYYKVIPAPEDKTLIFPPEYVITAKWPNGLIVGYQNLRYDREYSKVKFDKPIGTFRHEAIKQWNKGEYQRKKAELFKMYDAFIASLYSDEPYTDDGFAELLNTIIEPSLRPFYMRIGKGFYHKFLSQ
jgi:hypothetical protein